MYLQKLREQQVGIGNWPTDTPTVADTFNRLFDVADATLNSWKEAHELFESVKHQGISPLSMASMGMLVREALAKQEGWDKLTKYDAEILTYALLREWLDVAREEQRVQAHKSQGMTWEQAVLSQPE